MAAEETFEHDEGMDFLDMLVTLTASWKLLFFGPLIAAVVAGGLSFLWPKTYQSVAVVRLSEPELALMDYASVLDPVIEKLGLLPEFEGLHEDARRDVSKRLTKKLDKKTGLATITAAAPTPEDAREMLKAVLDGVLKELLPKGKNKDSIEQTIRINERIIVRSTTALEQLQKQIGATGQNDSTREPAMKYYAALSADVAKKELENAELKRSLIVRGEELYVQSASLPEQHTLPKTGWVILASSVAAFLAFFCFVFIRRAWHTTVQSPKSLAKIKEIKKALRGI